MQETVALGILNRQTEKNSKRAYLVRFTSDSVVKDGVIGRLGYLKIWGDEHYGPCHLGREATVMATNSERNYGGVDAIMIALNLDVVCTKN